MTVLEHLQNLRKVIAVDPTPPHEIGFFQPFRLAPRNFFEDGQNGLARLHHMFG